MTPFPEFVPREEGSGTRTWSWEHADEKAAHTVPWGLLASGFPETFLVLKKKAH